jgi:hypothetical protein
MGEVFDEWIADKHKWIEGWNSGKPALMTIMRTSLTGQLGRYKTCSCANAITHQQCCEVSETKLTNREIRSAIPGEKKG